MRTKIEIRNEASLCYIDIEGVIGASEEEQFSPSSQSIATYERLKEELTKVQALDVKEVVVNIRSTGGDVNDALLIYEALSSLDAKIITRCYGYTASAATIIAQAASDGCREIAASALYLVHMSSSVVEGNSADLAERIELLTKTDDRIATLYALHSSRDKAEFIALMGENGGRGRWLSPEEVVEAGLADVVIGGEETAPKRGLINRIKGWLNLSSQSKSVEPLPVDINILHAPSNLQTSTSVIAFREGQHAVSSTQTMMKEDPSLDGVALSQNALAYADDALKLKSR